jgi:hypothetical protein
MAVHARIMLGSSRIHGLTALVQHQPVRAAELSYGLQLAQGQAIVADGQYIFKEV